MKPTVELKDFDGDFDTLAAVMQRSWAENREQPLLYTPEYLAAVFEHPEASFALAPAIYRDGTLAAFGAALPRTLRLAGRDLRVAIACFLTVDAAYKSSSYGAAIWRELLKRGRGAGLDGALSLCVEGDQMNTMIVGMAKLMKLPLQHVFSISYMARPLRAGGQADAHARDGAVDILLEASAAIAAPLARTWTRGEAQWQCGRPDAVVATLAVGERRGIITGYTMRASGKDATQCVLIDDLLWGALAGDERQTLLDRFLAEASARGAELAVTPLLGYCDTEPLTRGRFRKTRRVLNVYLSLWNGEAPAELLDAVYFDVF